MRIETIKIKRDFLSNINIPVFIKNTDGIYTYCNKAFAQFMGMPEHQIVGNKVHQLVSKKYSLEHEYVDRILLETAIHQRYSTSISAGASMRKIITFNKSVIYDDAQAISGIIGIVTDSDGNVVARTDVVKKLTSRELDVLNLLLAGKSVKAIALSLGISVHTAGGHMKSIYIKLGAHSKNEALYRAIAIFGMSPR